MNNNTTKLPIETVIKMNQIKKLKSIRSNTLRAMLSERIKIVKLVLDIPVKCTHFQRYFEKR